MKITRISCLSGIERTIELPITWEQWGDYMNGILIQDALPHLSANEREFIISGITQEEWDSTFKEEKQHEPE
jgi:hypothetical protein